jgi:pyruvate/2-oxoglutarate dehydrogenase complex dihydrolipoamide acyltransferase (E2) component
MPMPTPVRLPNLGAEAAEARVVAWLKVVGDVVAAGEPIAEIETEKATVELEAPVAGTLTEILVPAGADATVGATLAIIADA